MIHFAYLTGLFIGITGLLIIDSRLHLAFWYDVQRTWRTILPAMLIFIVWDLAGIISGVFHHGASRYSLPFTIAPQFPIEELFFLFLLCYTALLLFIAAKKLWQRT